MRHTLSLVAALVFLTGMALAHGNERHIMGTVSKVNGTTITVTTEKGQHLEVRILPETKFTKHGAVIGVKDVKHGDRIVIHATEKEGRLTAQTVQVGNEPKK